MRIAYIVPYVPNLIRTRPYNLIAQLTSLGHYVALFTLGANKQEMIAAQTLEAICSSVHHHSQPTWRSLWNCVAAIPSSSPLQSVYSWQREMALHVSQYGSRSEFDVVHVEHLRGARYASFLKSMCPTLPIVWDSVDCISHLFRQAAGQGRDFFGRFVTRFELPRTEKMEGSLVCKFDHVLVTSPVDRDALLDLVPSQKSPSPISVLPNGVDLNYFHPNPDIHRDEETIIFSGKMSYHANIAMVRHLISEIMPRIWRVRPSAQLYIVGKDPPSDIKVLGKDPLITVTGTVDDIRPFLWRATVSVVPLLYGAGIQNKILEAMATGTPVVTTGKALTALQMRPGKDLLACDDPDEFSRAVIRLIGDRALQREIGEAGVAYVRAFHDWARVACQLVDVYQQTLKSKPRFS